MMSKKCFHLQVSGLCPSKSCSCKLLFGHDYFQNLISCATKNYQVCSYPLDAFVLRTVLNLQIVASNMETVVNRNMLVTFS